MRQTIPGHYKTQSLDNKNANLTNQSNFPKSARKTKSKCKQEFLRKYFLLGNTFNQLLVEHGFVAAEK